jgi:hypothetical protein
MAKGRKVKTMVADLRWVFITGEGRNNAMKGEEPHMQYTASVLLDKNGPEHKAIEAQIDAEWEAYKKEFGVKGKPKTNGIKDYMIPSPTGEIDPDTEEVLKVESGKVLVTFKSNTTWKDGKPQVIKVFKPDGSDITAAVHAAAWSIGEGSRGIIHGVAQGNSVGGKDKVTLYLSAVQLQKLVKYEGSSIETEVIDDGEDIDLGDDGMEAVSTDNKPAL